MFDSLLAKKWALNYAENASCTILHVYQIMMAKQAGGPKLVYLKLSISDDST